MVTYSQSARTALRNVCRAHEGTIVRRFGRAALFEPTELGAFLALRLREKYPEDVQVEQTRPLNEFEEVPSGVREAARAYEDRDQPHTPYERFARGTTHPDPSTMQRREL